MMVMVVAMPMVVPFVFFHLATRLFKRPFEIFIDPRHLLDGRPDISRNLTKTLIDHRFLPFAVFTGMLFVMIDPVLQQYFYFVSMSHSLFSWQVYFLARGKFFHHHAQIQAGERKILPARKSIRRMTDPVIT